MVSQLKKMQIHTKFPALFSKRLYLLITILLVLGIFFRFVNLEQKVYWTDEVLTSSRIAGYTAKEGLNICFLKRVECIGLYYSRITLVTATPVAEIYPGQSQVDLVVQRLGIEWRSRL